VRNVVWFEAQTSGEFGVSIERPMEPAIGRVFQFLQQECPNHRLEWLGGTPVGHWIFVVVTVVLKMSDKVGRVGRLVDDRRGLLCQRQFPDREWIDIFSVLVD